MVYDVAVVGSYAYVAAGTNGMRVINVADPAAPIAVGAYDTPGEQGDFMLCVAEMPGNWTSNSRMCLKSTRFKNPILNTITWSGGRARWAS